jgi:uncharacterized protein (DUF885 family)
MSSNQTPARSEIFALADAFIDKKASLNPILATMHGVQGYESDLPDFSLAGSAREADLTRATLATVQLLSPIDDVDRIARAVMIERLESELELHDSYEAHILFSVLASPISTIRQVFEMMPATSVAEISSITARLHAIPTAQESWRSSLIDLQEMGKSTAQRQAIGVAKQLATYGGGAYLGFANQVDPGQIHPEFRTAAERADASCAELSSWISNSYVPTPLRLAV